jgi:hypothetical protein
MGTQLNKEKKCVPDDKPFMLLIQKTNIFGLSLDKSLNGTPEIGGIVPLSGLSNAFDADFNPMDREVG